MLIKPAIIVSVTLAATLLAISTAASAATLNINGTVATSCSVAVNSDTGTFSFDSSPSYTLGTIDESCNDPDGYIVSLSSANDGLLNNTAAGTTSAAYTVSYGALVDAPLTIAAQDANTTGATTAPQSATNTLSMKVPTESVLTSGTYTDTITITIAAR